MITVVSATRVYDDAGFRYEKPIHCVVNSKGDIFAAYQGQQSYIQAAQYLNKLQDMERIVGHEPNPPALGGSLVNGKIYG